MARKIVPFSMWKGLSADYLRTCQHIPVPPGWTIEELLDPNAWAHHISKFHRNDLVEFVAEDGAFDVTARVVDVRDGQVFFRVLLKWTDEASAKAAESTDAAASEEPPEGYKVDRTPRTGWRAVRLVDGREVGRHYADRSEAIAAALDHSKAIAA
jgi:hypothetical protein